jgi:hypothetical protein
VITEREGHRRFEPEEIEQVLGVTEHGDMTKLAKLLRRNVHTLYNKKYELQTAQRARAARPAVFLPDDGMPYAVRLALILREAER